MCDDIGEAAYNTPMVASALVSRLRALPDGPALLLRVAARYKMELPDTLSDEHVVAAIAAAIPK